MKCYLCNEKSDNTIRCENCGKICCNNHKSKYFNYCVNCVISVLRCESCGNENESELGKCCYECKKNCCSKCIERANWSNKDFCSNCSFGIYGHCEDCWEEECFLHTLCPYCNTCVRFQYQLERCLICRYEYCIEKCIKKFYYKNYYISVCKKCAKLETKMDLDSK